MDYETGIPLNTLLSKYGQEFPLPLIRLIVCQLVLLLSELHEKGVLYRDLKLPNILLSRTGKVKLVDFGLSKILKQKENNSTNSPCGTPHCFPPIPKSSFYSFEVDFFSLGVVGHELARFSPPISFFKDFDQARQTYNSELCQALLTLPIEYHIFADLLNDYQKLASFGWEKLKLHPFFGDIWESVNYQNMREGEGDYFNEIFRGDEELDWIDLIIEYIDEGDLLGKKNYTKQDDPFTMI